MDKRNVVFLQLPQTDNDVEWGGENLPLAAAYLRHALERSPESEHYRAVFLPPQVDTWDDAHVLRAILRNRPSVIAATLYLWNIERTLHILAAARRALPELKAVVGGPEVARDHPFLFDHPAIDAVVTGEGEPVLPLILRAFRTQGTVSLNNVAWRDHGAFAWGTAEPPSYSLGDDLPPPRYRYLKPDRRGMAYIEASRGCPMHCSFCRYGQDRSRTVYLPADEVIRRIDIQWRRGARDVRFIDPTFNSNPAFHDILRGLAVWNNPRRVGFFAEMVGATVSEEDAAMLAAAGFVDIEVGIQSRNPTTLETIHRSPRLAKLDRGIDRLVQAGLKVTADLMYALPGQTLADIRDMLNWAVTQKGVHIQCMQTLLLPGTELRGQRETFGMVAHDRPPYQVRRTHVLSEEDIRTADTMMRQMLKLEMDAPTARFVGTSLPDLFEDVVRLDIPMKRLPLRMRGAHNRRAVVFAGDMLYVHREQIVEIVRRAVETEPFALWQFILEPSSEEPLDLLDVITRELERFPMRVTDQFIEMQAPGHRASRRLLIRLLPGRSYDADWRESAEQWLGEHYF